jgi:hypothetical protein
MQRSVPSKSVLGIPNDSPSSGDGVCLERSEGGRYKRGEERHREERGETRRETKEGRRENSEMRQTSPAAAAARNGWKIASKRGMCLLPEKAKDHT